MMALFLIAALLQDTDWKAYYPLEVGCRWTFDADGATVPTRVVSKVKIKETECFLVEEERKGGKIRYYFSVSGAAVLLHKINDQVLEEPISILRFPLKKGQKWTISSSGGKASAEVVAEDEEIEVEAGKFKCFRVRTQNKDGTSVTEQWFAKDVGVVKTVGESKGVKHTLALKKFEKP